MAGIASIVGLGFGFGSTVGDVVTFGFGIGEAPVVVVEGYYERLPGIENRYLGVVGAESRYPRLVGPASSHSALRRE